MLANPHVDKAVDEALIASGRAIARSMDKVDADDLATPTERTKAMYLAPHLVSILRELLATPLSRKNVGLAAAEGKTASRLSLIKGQATKATK